MKKRWLLVGLFVSILGMSGCSSAISLKEDEENMVAEYMAKELLESQESYTQELLEPTKAPILTPEPTATTPPKATATPTPSSNSSGDEEDNFYANADFAQVMGMANIKVEYTGYEKVESLTESGINFEATEGQELLIVKFDVKNTSKKDIQFNLSDLNISYLLDINTELKVKPLITLKENDLRFIDLKIKANEKKETVLMFVIDKGVKIEDSNLIISRNDKTAIIVIE